MSDNHFFNIPVAIFIFKRLDTLERIFERLAEIGSVEKVGVEPDPKRVGPASWNLEYG